jgi:hypothetical protein
VYSELCCLTHDNGKYAIRRYGDHQFTRRSTPKLTHDDDVQDDVQDDAEDVTIGETMNDPDEHDEESLELNSAD